VDAWGKIGVRSSLSILLLTGVTESLFRIMARPLRIDVPNGIYHVTTRGLDRLPIVRDDADREKWTELLDRVAARLATVYLCRSLTRRSVREIGEYFGGVNGQAVSNLVGKMAHEREGDKKLNRRLSAIEKTLRQNG